MKRKNFGLVVLIAATLLQTSPMRVRAWMLGPAGLIPTPLTSRTVSIEPVTQADFNGDGKAEKVFLTGSKARISSAGRIVWQSPETWQVLQASITDLNHDGAPEAALLVWRPFHPWPVDQWLPDGGRISTFHDAGGNSCQIILIGWQDGQYREMWAGSALAEPVKSFSAVDLNGDGLQELVTLEGIYTDSKSASARALKAWEWNGFGFSIVSKIDGIFSKMAVVQTGDGRTQILTP